MDKIKKDELLNLKKEMETEPEIIENEAKIIYDGRQYSVRIPAKIAKTININPETDKIKFKVIIPSKFDEEPKLEIELIHNASD